LLGYDAIGGDSMKKYYITKVTSFKKEMFYNEETDTEHYTHGANIIYKECTKEEAMERLERDRKLINMIDALRR
jgi:hypothetical protein